MIDPENWLLAGGRKVRNFTNGLHIDALELGILSGSLVENDLDLKNRVVALVLEFDVALSVGLGSLFGAAVVDDFQFLLHLLELGNAEGLEVDFLAVNRCGKGHNVAVLRFGIDHWQLQRSQRGRSKGRDTRSRGQGKEGKITELHCS